jgi:predicted nucleic acid-binding protein
VIVVDTSVWVEAARRPASGEATLLQQLLDADEVALALPVRLELLGGVARKDRRALKRGLSALPVLRPDDGTWRTIESWIEPAADAGFRFSVTDLLIAALARDIGALVWTIDDDFSPMERLGFLQLHGNAARGRRR